jgi:hypothetical protein
VGEGSSRSWKWRLIPKKPGPASLILVASTYDGRSQVVLRQEYIPIRMMVKTSAAFVNEQNSNNRWRYLRWGRVFIDTTAGLIVTVGGAAAVVASGLGWLHARKARRRKAAHKHSRRSKSQPASNTVQ